MLKGSGAVIAGASGGAISSDMAIFLMTILFVAYGTAGGLGAAILTDFVQGILTIIFSFLLLPSVLAAVGGLDGMRSTISDSSMFSLAAPEGIGIFYISIISINALVGIVTQPHILANCAAGKTELEGQFGFMAGSLAKRFCTVAWCLTGLAGVAYYAGQELHPDHLYGLLANEFLPAILPGMLGLFIATLLASVMSSCDSFMIAASALFTRNIYKQALPGKSDRHYLLSARLASVGVVVLGVLYAYWLSGVIQGLEILWKIGPMMGIAFWMGLFWRRATTAGAWASAITALLMWWVGSHVFTGLSLPWQMILYLGAGLGSGIVVSLFTRPKDHQMLERYYALLRTPVLTEEGNPDEPCQIPEGLTPLPRKVFFPNSELEIPVPSRRAMTGFGVGWICVISIILLVYWLSVG
jgi:Na+/proline symporter